MKQILVLSILLFSAGCYSIPDPADLQLQQIEEQTEDIGEQVKQLNIERENLTAQEQKFVTDQNDYFKKSKEFAPTITMENYYGDEVQCWLKEGDDLLKRARELDEKEKAYKRKVENFRIRAADVKQNIRDFNAYMRQRSLMRERMDFDREQQLYQQWHEDQLYQNRRFRSP